MKLSMEMALMELGNQYIAVPVNRGPVNKLVRLNDTGKVIFNGITEGLEEDAIVRRITEEYAVSESDAYSAVRKVIELLRKEGILEK